MEQTTAQQESGNVRRKDFELYHDGVLGRCPECGRLIMLPCLACRIMGTEMDFDVVEKGVLELNLKDDEQLRYLEVHAYRNPTEREIPMFPLIQLMSRAFLKQYSLNNKTSCKKFLTDLLAVAKPLAAQTKTEIDDKILQEIEYILKNDALFDYFYKLISNQFATHEIIFEEVNEAEVTAIVEQSAAELEYAYNAEGLLVSMTLRENSGNVLKPVKRVLYSYYSDEDSCGNAGDLKAVVSELAINDSWITMETYHYRYYKSGEPGGPKHAMKMAFFPADYDLFAQKTGNVCCCSIPDRHDLARREKIHEGGNRRVVQYAVER